VAALDTHQRCWNHEAREAVCRCTGCTRSYCRECVAEHQGRLLCAACLGASSAVKGVRRGMLRRIAPAAMIASGLLIAWLAYWTMGEALIGMIRGAAQSPSAQWILPGGSAAPERSANCEVDWPFGHAWFSERVSPPV
jgi:hypothetical protein